MRGARAASFVAVGALVWALWSSRGFDGRHPACLNLVGPLLMARGTGAGLSLVAAIAAVAGRRSRPGTEAPR